MEHLSHELEQRNKNWQDLSEEEAVSLAAECVDAVAERYQGRKYFQSNRVSFMLKRLKNEGGSFGLGDVAPDAGGRLCADLHGKKDSGAMIKSGNRCVFRLVKMQKSVSMV